jgi:integrase
MSIYRVTPKRGKWIVIRKEDRKTISDRPFATKTEAKAFMANLEAAAAAKENKINQVATGGITFVFAFKDFAEAKKNEHQESQGIRQTSANRYDTTFRLRILKYLKGPNRIDENINDEDVLLSEFGNKHMKSLLMKAADDNVPYRTLINTVKDIKYFLREANADGLSPNMSMTTFKADKFGYIKPKDDNQRYGKEVEILDDAKILQMLIHLKSEFGKNTSSTNTFAIVCLLFLFGLRASELSALKKASVDLVKMLLHVKGTYIPAEGGYLNQTKNRGSRRSIPIDANAAKFLTEWLEYLDKNYKYSIWLLPSNKGNGPLGYKYINAHIWKAYAAMGLADITCKRDGHVVINSSPLKGSPTKMFRHRLASHLIAAMNKFGVLSQNQVKSIVGHTQFSTTAGIYGNKLVAMSNQARSEVAVAKETATNADLISQVISKNN